MEAVQLEQVATFAKRCDGTCSTHSNTTACVAYSPLTRVGLHSHFGDKWLLIRVRHVLMYIARGKKFNTLVVVGDYKTGFNGTRLQDLLSERLTHASRASTFRDLPTTPYPPPPQRNHSGASAGSGTVIIDEHALDCSAGVTIDA